MSFGGLMKKMFLLMMCLSLLLTQHVGASTWQEQRNVKMCGVLGLYAGMMYGVASWWRNGRSKAVRDMAAVYMKAFVGAAIGALGCKAYQKIAKWGQRERDERDVMQAMLDNGAFVTLVKKSYGRDAADLEIIRDAIGFNYGSCAVSHYYDRLARAFYHLKQIESRYLGQKGILGDQLQQFARDLDLAKTIVWEQVDILRKEEEKREHERRLQEIKNTVVGYQETYAPLIALCKQAKTDVQASESLRNALRVKFVDSNNIAFVHARNTFEQLIALLQGYVTTYTHEELFDGVSVLLSDLQELCDFVINHPDYAADVAHDEQVQMKKLVEEMRYKLEEMRDEVRRNQYTISDLQMQVSSAQAEAAYARMFKH